MLCADQMTGGYQVRAGRSRVFPIGRPASAPEKAWAAMLADAVVLQRRRSAAPGRDARRYSSDAAADGSRPCLALDQQGDPPTAGDPRLTSHFTRAR